MNSAWLLPGIQLSSWARNKSTVEEVTSNLPNSFIQYFVARNQQDGGALITADDISRIADCGFAGEFFKACSFEYHGLDIFDGDDITLFDLNYETLLERIYCKFDLVTNFGITEHMLNQYLAFKTMHEFVKPGGILYHDLPMSGYHLHGYFN